MKKLNFRKQYLACAVLAAVCAGFIYTPQVAEAKFGVITGYSDYDNGDVAKFLGKDWYVVGGTVTTGTPTTLTLLSKDCWNDGQNDVKTIFNPASTPPEDRNNNYGSSPYQTSVGQNDSGSTLKNCLEGIYTGLTEDAKFGVDMNYTKAVNAINQVNLGTEASSGYVFGSAHFYAPSKDEIKSGGTFGLDDQRKTGKDYWLRSSYEESPDYVYYLDVNGDVAQNSATNEKYIRPVIQVSVADAGTTLQNAVESKNHTSCFSVSTDALTGIAGSTFVGNGSASSTQAYASVADTAPNLDCTYLVLDGTSINIKSDAYTGINNGTVDAPVYCTTIGAVLLNENDLASPLASGSTFANVDGKIDYMATLSEDSGTLSGNLSGVAAGTYGLKIFGIDNINYKATQLGTGVINKLKKSSDGKLNITIGSVNGGFALSLANGAGVVLDGNANNEITVGNGTANIDLAGKILNSDISFGSDLTIKSTGGNGTIGADGGKGTVSGTGNILVYDNVTFKKSVDTGTGIFSVQEGGNVVLCEGISTSSLNVGNGGNVTSDGVLAVVNSGKVNLGNSASLTVMAKNLKANVAGNNADTNFTVNLTGSGDDNILQYKITKGIVNVGKSDSISEKVTAIIENVKDVGTINIGKNNDKTLSDTLKITDVSDDTNFATNISGGNLSVAGTADKIFTLSGTVDVQSINIDTLTLQIPAELLIAGSSGSWDVQNGKKTGFITFDGTNGGVLNLDLNEAHYTLGDLAKIRGYWTGTNEKVLFVDGKLDLTGDEKLSVEANDSGVIENATVSVHEASDGSKVADEISASDKYVMVAKANTNYQTPAVLSEVTIQNTPAENYFVAKGLQTDYDGKSTLNIISESFVTLAGGLDSDGNVSSPFVDKDLKSLKTKVVIKDTSALQIGVESGSAATQGMTIKELNFDGGGTLNVKKAYLNVENVASNGGKIVIDPSYVKNSNGSIFNAETTVVQDGSVLNVGNMDVEVMKKAAVAWGKSTTNTLGGGFVMNSGAMVGLGSVAMPANGKLWLTNKDSTHSEQVHFGGNSMLAVKLPAAYDAVKFDGSTIQGILYNVTSLGAEDGASLYVDGEVTKDKFYVIISGTGVNPDGSQIVWKQEDIYSSDAAMELVPVTSEELEETGLTIDKFKSMIVLKATEGDFLMKEPELEPHYPVMQAIVDDTNSEANKLYADIKNAYRRNHKGGVAAMENLFGQPNVASVFKSGLQVASLISDATLDHTSLVERDVNYSADHHRPSLRNVVADGSAVERDPEYVGVGKVTEIMPYRENKKYNSQQNDFGSNKSIQRNYYGSYKDDFRSSASAASSIRSHGGGGGGGSRKSSNTFKTTNNYSGGDDNKQIWASYLHSKEEIDGLKTGSTEREGTNTTNGAVVGADLWSSEHAFGGLSVSYAKTDVETGSDFGKITNDVETYGVGIYHRHDYRTGAVIFDGGYTHNENEIKQTMNLARSYDLEAKPKVEIFDAGLRYEHKCHVDENAAVVPYVGVRYTMVDPESYCNNVGIRYGTRRDDIISVPVGLRLSVNWHTSDSVIVKPYVDLGYKWNVGQDDWQQKVIYGNAMSKMKYDVLDKRCFFWNAGLQIIGNTFTFGAGYHYSSSENVKNRQWTINANWEM